MKPTCNPSDFHSTYSWLNKCACNAVARPLSRASLVSIGLHPKPESSALHKTHLGVQRGLFSTPTVRKPIATWAIWRLCAMMLRTLGVQFGPAGVCPPPLPWQAKSVLRGEDTTELNANDQELYTFNYQNHFL